MKSREWWRERPKWLDPVLWTLLIIALAELLLPPIGDRMAGLSDSLWWAVLPWVLIVGVWAWMLRRMSKEGSTRQE